MKAAIRRYISKLQDDVEEKKNGLWTLKPAHQVDFYTTGLYTEVGGNRRH